MVIDTPLKLNIRLNLISKVMLKNCRNKLNTMVSFLFIFKIYNSFTKNYHTKSTLPTINSSGTSPHERESVEFIQLSPHIK